MRQRPAFTFIECMITLAIFAILAAIFYPMVVDLGDVSAARVMAATVRHVREKISVHAVTDPSSDRSPDGYPMDIKPEWFSSGNVPLHTWTGDPMKVHVVNGPRTARVPPKYTYQCAADGRSVGHDAWYNVSNGFFCALVPDIGTEAEVRGMFELINGFDEGEMTDDQGPGNGNGEGRGDDD